MNASQIHVDNSLQRLRYFFGQLLTQRDLSAEQAFHLLLQRLTQREAFGTGTVAGLRVVAELDSTQTPLSVYVLPGLAMDPDGRELLLESPACVVVADVPLTATPFPFSPTPVDEASLAAVVASTFGSPFTVGDLDAVVTGLFERGLMTEEEKDEYFGSGTITVIRVLLELIEPSTPVPTPPTTLPEWLVEQLVGTTYVGIRYVEHGADPAPAVLDASCCGGAQCFASRDQEGVSLATSATPFPEIPDPFAEFQSCLDGDPEQICECLLDAWRGLPASTECPPVATPIVALAKVYWAKHERAPESQILSIDNCELRPLAPGGPMIRALAGNDLTSLPPVDVTKAPAEVGVATTAARADHKHDVLTAAPVSIGSANLEGTAISLARSDHVHDGRMTAISDTIAAPANNYSPPDFATADVVRVVLTGDQTISGMAAPGSGARTRKIISNVDDVDELTLSHEDTNSSEANRLSLPRALPIVLGPGEAVELWYDPTLGTGTPGRWTVVGQSGQLYDAVSAWFREEVDNMSVGPAGASIDFKNGQKQTVALIGNAPLTLVFPGVGNYILRVVQGPSGGPFTPVLSVSGGSVLAPGGTLIYTAASDAIDVLSLYFNGQDVYAVMAANFQVV